MKSTPLLRYSIIFIPMGAVFLLLCVILYLTSASGQDNLDSYSEQLADLVLLATLLSLLAVLGAVYVVRRELAREKSAVGALNSERQFRVLLRSAPDAIVVVDDSGLVKVINQAAMDLFGYSEEEFANLKVEQLLPERYRSPHVEYRQGYMLNPTVRPMGQSKELYAKHKDGREIPVEISLSPLRRDDGASWVTAIVRDVSVQREHLRQINILNQQLESRSTELEAINKELEAFSYSVSHDLRAPLRAIDGFSHTVLRLYEDKIDEKGQDRLRRIRAAAQNMGKLIDDLLVLSRISRADVKVEQVDLTALAESILRGLEENDPNRKVSVEVEQGMTACADARLISVALTNLLSNAWKFTSHQDNPFIEVFTERQDGETVHAVRDNGAGFNMDYADKLFGAFQRLHDAGEFPGTGIGLATVQRVIHKHGGRVWAMAQEGLGATFYFSLPEDAAS